MKKITLLFAVLAIIFASCTKQASNKLAPHRENISFKQLSDLITEEQAFKAFEAAGKTEVNQTARGRKVQANATLGAWIDALILTQDEVGFHCTSPENPRYSAFQNLTTAQSPFYCNYFVSAPGPAQPYDCNDAILTNGNIRFFTQTYPDFDIWVSNVITN